MIRLLAMDELKEVPDATYVLSHHMVGGTEKTHEKNIGLVGTVAYIRNTSHEFKPEEYYRMSELARS
jgi:hypothetical protein